MRVKALFAILALLIAVSFLFNASLTVQADNPALDDYINQRHRLHAMERRPYAIETITQSRDPEVLKEALEDLLKFSSTSFENLVALHYVDEALNKISGIGQERQAISLFKARVLLRLIRMEESNAIFLQAFEQKWDQAQYEYERGLLETGDFIGMAVHEFERVSGYVCDGEYQVAPYDEGVEDLGRFKMYLGRLKADAPEASVMDAVYAKIDELHGASLMKEMAKALCLSEDGRYQDALNVIENAEANEESDDPARRFILVHKAIVLMDKDEIAEAQAAFREFMEALGDNYKLIYSSGIRFARSMERTQTGRAKMDEITGLLIDSPIVQDEDVKQTFSDYDIAHLYDLYQQGLAWSGQLDKAAEIKWYVIHNYPENLAWANCVMNYAIYLSWYDGGNLEAALSMLEMVTTRAPLDAIMPWVRLLQAELLLKQGNRFQALNYIQDAITRTLVNEGGSVRDVLTRSMELQQHALGK